MKARKLADSSTFSDVRDSTSSHTTASEGGPGAAFSARSAAAEIWESISSIEIEPSMSMSSSRRSPTITLASSRATSHRITSPSGRFAPRARGRPGWRPRDRCRAARARARTGSWATTIRRWTMRRLAYLGGADRLSPASAARTIPARRPSATSPTRTSSATWTRRRRPGSRSWASPSTSTASARRSTIWRPSVLGTSRRPTTSTPTASSSARRRCGSGSRPTSSPAPRTGSPTCSSGRDFDYVVGSVHRRRRPHGRPRRLRRVGGRADPDRRVGALLRPPGGGRPLGLFDILAHPDLVKMWGRRAPVAGARPALPLRAAVEAIAETGIAVEVSTAGLRKPVGEIYPVA